MQDLNRLVNDIADACVAIDRDAPAFKAFRRGIGPYGEPQAVKLIAAELNKLDDYRGLASSKRLPDMLIRGQWALEFKIARPFGDNGLEAENWSVNLLHPYSGNVSVFADCLKLSRLPGAERRAAVVLGFEHAPANIDLDVLFRAFEAICAVLLPFTLSQRAEATRTSLVHPVHQVLRVAAWEVPAPA